MYEIIKKMDSFGRTLLFSTGFMSLLGVFLTGYQIGCENISSAVSCFSTFIICSVSFFIVLNKVVSESMKEASNSKNIK